MKCRRNSAHCIYGSAYTKPDDGGDAHYYWPNGGRRDRRSAQPQPAPVTPAAKPASTRPRARFLPDRFAVSLTPALLKKLAAALGLPAWSVDGFPGIGFRFGDDHAPDAWTFAQHDGAGHVIGFATRQVDGIKKHVAGTHSGLFIPPTWRDGTGPILLVEGPSDTLAATAAGLSAIGRPSNIGGIEFLAELLRDAPADRPLIVVGENDRKDNGHWPGRHGAYTTATQLAARIGGQVKWVQVPDGDKDTRDWLIRHTGGTGSRGAWHKAGERFAASLLASAIDAGPGPPMSDHMDMPDESPACTNPFKALLKGKPGTKREGQRRAADFNCRRWKCPPCKARHVNHHLSRLYRCIVQWADPLRLHPIIPLLTAENVKTGNPPGFYPPPECPAGPWELRMTLVDEGRRHSLIQKFGEWNRLRRRVEYVTIKVNRVFSLLDMYCVVVINRELQSQYMTTTQYQLTRPSNPMFLLVAAFHPELAPPPDLPRISADTALQFIAEHLACFEPSAKRNDPVATSTGWKSPKSAAGPWSMEGSRAHDIHGMRRIFEQLGYKLLEDREAAITWADATLGPDIAQWLVELCRDQSLTEDEIVNLLKIKINSDT